MGLSQRAKRHQRVRSAILSAIGARAVLMAAPPAAAARSPHHRGGGAATSASGRPSCAATATFIKAVWPLLASKDDVIVETTLRAPYDMSRSDHRPENLQRVTAASPIWQGGWTGRERPSAAHVRDWVAGQRLSIAPCLRTSRAPARVIDAREQQRLVRDWHSGTQRRAFSLGQPVWDESGSRSLMHISTAGAGLSGEDFLILFVKVHGRWRELSRLLLAQS